ncbi:MAG: amidohydrolase [Candidatus Binatia bacterium]
MTIPESMYSDLVLLNGNVITVDQENRVAQAVVVKSEHIAHVGTSEEARSFIGNGTQVFDLKGKTVLPGFIEPHTHFMSFGIRLRMVNVRTPPNNTIADVLDRIKERAAVTPKGEWIQAQGYEHTAIKERRWPTRSELDAAAPDHPLVITYRSSHVWMANNKALAMAGITKDTPQPKGGHIDKDPETGEPTGVLREKAASRSVTRLLPHPTVEQLKEGVVQAGKEYLAVGITSTHDAGTGDTPAYYRAYQEAIEEGRLKVRVYLMIHDLPYARFYMERDLGLRTGFGNERLRLGPVKTCSDGSIQVYTCAFYKPYIKSDTTDPTKDPTGVLQVSPEEQKRIVLEAHSKGYQVAIHAQGDRGIDVALDAIENAMEKYPRPNPRHRIEHCQCATRVALERMKRLGVIASFYPHHIWYWGDRHVSEFLGMERSSRIDPMKSANDLGVVTIAHSDTPIALPKDPLFATDPLFGIWCAVNRKTRGGLVLGPEERVTPMEAIRAYTINAAYASFEEDLKGSIETGKLADLVVLSESPLTGDPLKIRDIKVEKTIVGGEITHEA